MTGEQRMALLKRMVKLGWATPHMYGVDVDLDGLSMVFDNSEGNEGGIRNLSIKQLAGNQNLDSYQPDMQALADKMLVRLAKRALVDQKKDVSELIDQLSGIGEME